MEAGKILIGWTWCRVSYKAMPKWSFYILAFGHEAQGCKGPDQSCLCYNYGEVRHKSAWCSNTAKCMLCTVHNIDQGASEHQMKSTTCPVYWATVGRVAPWVWMSFRVICTKAAPVAAEEWEESRCAGTEWTVHWPRHTRLVCWQVWYSGSLYTWPEVPLCRRNGVEESFVWVKISGITYVVSCYFTLNELIESFESKLDNLEDTLRGMNGESVVTGDINAKAIEWGMPEQNSRGKHIMKMAVRTGLSVLNVGNMSTFRRPGCLETIPGVSFATDVLASGVQDWQVTKDYTGSDHQYITFQVLNYTSDGHSTLRQPPQ